MTFVPSEKLVELKDKVLLLKGQGFWNDPENLHDQIMDLADEVLLIEPGEPAPQNLEWLRNEGIRVEIVRKPEKHFPDFWYGEVYIDDRFNITFKSRGQEFSGI